MKETRITNSMYIDDIELKSKIEYIYNKLMIDVMNVELIKNTFNKLIPDNIKYTKCGFNIVFGLDDGLVNRFSFICCIIDDDNYMESNFIMINDHNLCLCNYMSFLNENINYYVDIMYNELQKNN